MSGFCNWLNPEIAPFLCLTVMIDGSLPQCFLLCMYPLSKEKSDCIRSYLFAIGTRCDCGDCVAFTCDGKQYIFTWIMAIHWVPYSDDLPLPGCSSLIQYADNLLVATKVDYSGHTVWQKAHVVTGKSGGSELIQSHTWYNFWEWEITADSGLRTIPHLDALLQPCMAPKQPDQIAWTEGMMDAFNNIRVKCQ